MGDIKENIAKNISYYRKRLKLTQSELAEKLGVRTTTVSTWERGASSPDIETLYSICKILKVSLDEIYGSVPPNPILTTAAHRDGDIDWTEEEKAKIEEYKQLLVMARNAKNKE